MTQGSDTIAPLHLRPRGTLLRDGLVAAALALPLMYAASFWATAGRPTVPLLVAVQVLGAIGIGVAAWRFALTGVWVDGSTVAERGFFSRMRRVDRSEIVGVVRARTFRSGTESIPQLFLVGADGSTLVRLRGQFWTSESMDAVVRALAVPVTELPDVVTTRELAAEHPQLVYWFERNRLALGLAVAGAAAAVAVPITAMVAFFN